MRQMFHWCPITCHCGFQQLISVFFKPLKMWKSYLKTLIFALLWRLGTQRAHTLQYPSSMWTVFLYSSDDQLQHSGIILNCDFSVFPGHLLHSYCNKVHPWYARQTSEIIMDIQLIFFELWTLHQILICHTLIMPSQYTSMFDCAFQPHKHILSIKTKSQ